MFEIRFTIRSLLLATLNVSLFLGATVWAVRGPDAGVEPLFDAMARSLRQSGEFDAVLGMALITPVVFLGGLIATVLTALRVGRCPYALCQVIGFSLVATVACGVWFFTSIDLNESPLVAARVSLPLAVAAVGVVVEVAARRLPAPYWILGGVSLLMAASYDCFIIGVWASGGKF